MTDIHTADYRTGMLWNSTLKAAYSNFTNTQFMMHAGDFVDYGSNDEQWQYAFNLNKAYLMNTTIVPATGNHDGQDRWVDVFEYFANHFHLDESAIQSRDTGVHYKIDFGYLEVFVINSEDVVNQQLSPNQMQWLEQSLTDSTATWKIVMSHRGLYSGTSRFLSDTTMTNMRLQLVPMFAKHGVDLFLFGHDHIYYRSQPMANGTVQESFMITEIVNGVEHTYHVNLDGTVHLLPNAGSTAKFYELDPNVNPNQIHAAVLAGFSQAVFVHFSVDAYKLTLNAYRVNDQNQAITLYDSYAIYKIFDDLNERIAQFEVETLKLEDEQLLVAIRQLIEQIDQMYYNQIIEYEKFILLEEQLETLKSNDQTPIEPIDDDEPNEQNTNTIVVVVVVIGVLTVALGTTLIIKKKFKK